MVQKKRGRHATQSHDKNDQYRWYKRIKEARILRNTYCLQSMDDKKKVTIPRLHNHISLTVWFFFDVNGGQKLEPELF